MSFAIALLTISCIAALSLGVDHKRRQWRARRVNPLHISDQPVAEFEDHVLGAMLGLEYAALDYPTAQAPDATPPDATAAVQLMLSSARAIHPDGVPDPLLFRIELAHLDRYARGPRRQLSRLFSRAQRADLRTPLASPHGTWELLCATLPIALVWHDQPQRAAKHAAALLATTHTDAKLLDAARLLASATAHCLHLQRQAPASRRAWLQTVLQDACIEDSPLGTICERAAHLASLDAPSAEPSPVHELEAVPLWSLGLALRCFELSQQARPATELLNSMRAYARQLGKWQKGASHLAWALLGAFLGANALPAPAPLLSPRRCRSRLLANKLSAFPVVAAAASAAPPRALARSRPARLRRRQNDQDSGRDKVSSSTAGDSADSSDK